MQKRRVLLKLSGESLCKPGGFGIDIDALRELAGQIRSGVESSDLELALIVGGGNLLRGAQIAGREIDRVSAETMGMLATVMNALALGAALRSLGVDTRVLSALPPVEGTELFTCQRCNEHLSRGRVVILAGGTGNPYFTTDTTASLRALQIGARLVLKGTKVPGIYSADPESDPDAILYERLSYQEVLKQRLRVMDSTAISMCMDNQLPIRVFNMLESENIGRALRGEEIGTIVE